MHQVGQASRGGVNWSDAERDLLRICHLAAGRDELMRQLCEYFQTLCGCEAVGLRLCRGDDFPYYQTRGFPAEFVVAENSLCALDEQGDVLRDENGVTLLECTCGTILRGASAPSMPHFTPLGSFWTNNSSTLKSDASRKKVHKRERCINDGYESVALIPIRSDTKTFGLVQLNDRKEGLFCLHTIQQIEHLVGYVALALAKHEAEEALLKSQELLNETQRLTRVGGWEYDIVNKSIYWTDEMFRIHGINRTDINGDLGAHVDRSLACYDEADRPLVEQTFRLCVEQGVPYDFEVPFNPYRGDRIWVRITATPVIEDGRPVKANGYLMDITERRYAEEQQAVLQAQLTHARRVESIGRLAGGIAHDFNNMLMVILGHTEFALSSVPPDSLLHSDLQEVYDAAKRSSELTRQLLAFARKQTAVPKLLNLNDAVASMLKMLQRLIGEDIDLLWQPEKDLWPVLVDPAQVDQILANLSVNGRDSISGVGRITIKTANVPAAKISIVPLEGEIDGDYVLLSVSDTGCGMSTETLDHLFEPFYTTKQAGKGTGLGLATVYGVVKQNNGFIEVQSERGIGSCFNIYLPKATEGALLIAPLETAKPAGGGETVLLVEDELSIRKLGKKILSDYGYNVLVAGGAPEAIEIARRSQVPVDVLVTDVVMPVMNGKDLEQKIRSIFPNVRVLFMSGYTSDIIAHNGVIEEGFEFIQKPFSVKALAAKVRQVIDDGFSR